MELSKCTGWAPYPSGSMSGLFELDGLTQRLQAYVLLRGWRPEASVLLVEVLHRGEIARGDAEAITGLKERTSRDTLGLLLIDGIIGSDSQKGAVSLRFPVKALDVLFPQFSRKADLRRSARAAELLRRFS
jgi:hypothetical protein